LSDGIRLYDQGNYAAAIRKITSSNEIWYAGVSVQTEALKYLAFSYCITRREAQCRQEFEKALKLDPEFDLATNEKGHPLWGPVFAKAKARQ
jgi:tetratricopeptide (TPR) repeat protein